MSRKDLKAKDRAPEPLPDFKYDSLLMARFMNKLNFEGKKSVAQRVFYGAMDLIQKKTNEDPKVVFTRALDNIRPLVEVKPRRVGGATYQVPTEVRPERGSALAMRWLLQFARSKTGKPMSERLADEILSASKKEGLAYKKREDTHKMAEANKAFAHYKW
jgi:small subunit ribosomal protein S7